MRSKAKIIMIFTAIAISLSFSILLQAPLMAYSEEDMPTEDTTYTLTYPDGSVVTTNENGEPLTYDDVVRLSEVENWKLLAEGLISDGNGEVHLDSTWEKGTIRIVETKVPDGYIQGDESEKIVRLEDGETTLVNPKEPIPVDPPKEPEKETPPPTPSITPSITPVSPQTPSSTIPVTPTKTTTPTKPVTPTKTADKTPKTGVEDNIIIYIGLAVASLFTIGLLIKRERQ